MGTTNVWEFDTDGYLTLPYPGGSKIKGGPEGGINSIDLSWELILASGKTIKINPGASGVVSPTYFSFGSDVSGGDIIFPAGSVINDRVSGVLIGGAGQTAVNRFYTKVSNTLYQTVDEGVTYQLVNEGGTWALSVLGQDNPRYTSTNLLTWNTFVGAAPAPTGELSIRATELTVGTGNTWAFGGDGKLTVPGVITKDAALQLTSSGTTTTNGASVNVYGDLGRVLVRTDNGTSNKDWQFNVDGTTTFPNNTLQSRDGLTLTTGGEFNICTIQTAGSGYQNGNSTSYVTGGTGTDMVVGYGFGLSGQIVNVGVVAPGTGYTDGDVLTMTAGDGTATFVITRYNALANQANNNTIEFDWTFDTSGGLTLPGDIKSQGDINIVIDTPDSSTFNWQFGNNGVLTIPGDINTGTNKLVSGQGTLNLWDDSSVTFTGISNPAVIRTTTNNVAYKNWSFDLDGTLTVPSVTWNYVPTTFTAVPVTYGDTTLTFTVLLDNTIVNMSVAAGAGGYGPGSFNLTVLGTTFPGGTSPANDIVFNVTTFETPGPVFSTDPTSVVTYVSGTLPPRYNNITSAGSVGISANGLPWTFGTNGTLTFPNNTQQTTAWTGVLPAPANGDTVSGNANMVFYAGTDWYNTSRITINPATSMLTLNGNSGTGGITFPDATVQTTAWTGSTTVSSLVNSGKTLSLDTDGELSLPTNSYTEAVIKELDATALVLFAQKAEANIKLLAGATSAASAKQWLFNGTDGSLTLPGSIIGAATQDVFNTASTSVNAFGAATTLGIGNTATAAQTVNMFTASTGASTYNFATGATLNATTKTVNIGTRGVSGSTTNIAIGSAVSGATSALTISGSLVDATATSTAKSVGYLGLPQSATATTATLAIGDAGKHIYVTTAGQTMTIPANASVAYPIGSTVTFIAGSGATTVSIAIAGGDTLRLAGSASTGTRTLAANGMATAVKVAATTWYINGTGLT